MNMTFVSAHCLQAIMLNQEHLSALRSYATDLLIALATHLSTLVKDLSHAQWQHTQRACKQASM